MMEQRETFIALNTEVSPSSSNSSLGQSFAVTSFELESSSDSHQAATECTPTSLSITIRPRPCITFAPLPQLSPRKRRNSQPLGVAARSQALQNRRMQRGYGSEEEIQCYQSPMWTEEETEALEDPFLALGRMVKGAGKGLWRSVRRKKDSERRKKDVSGNDAAEQVQEKELEKDEEKEKDKDKDKEPVTAEEESDSSTLDEETSSEQPSKSSSEEDPKPLRDGHKFDWTSATTVTEDERHDK